MSYYKPSLEWILTPDTKNFNQSETVASDSYGNVYILGYFKTKITFGCTTLKTNTQGVFLSKASPEGCWVWAVKLCDMSSPGSVGNLNLSTDKNSNVYVSCNSFAGNYSFEDGSFFIPTPLKLTPNFASKLNTDGRIQYAVNYEGGDGGFVTNDNKGNAYITGTYTPELSIIFPGADVRINTVLTDSTNLFSVGFNDSGWTSGNTTALTGIKTCDEKCKVTPSVGSTYISNRKLNNIIVGNYKGKVYFDTLILESKSEFTNSLISVIDRNGNWLQVLGFESPNSNSINSCSTDCHGNVYVSGVYNEVITIQDHKLEAKKSNISYFIAKFTPDLRVVWLRDISIHNPLPATCQNGATIASRRDGTTFLYGFYTGTIEFGRLWLKTNKDESSFLVKMDSDGNFLWAVDIAGLDCRDLNGQNLLSVSKYSVSVTGVGQYVKVLGHVCEKESKTSFVINIRDC